MRYFLDFHHYSSIKPNKSYKKRSKGLGKHVNKDTYHIPKLKTLLVPKQTQEQSKNKGQSIGMALTYITFKIQPSHTTSQDMAILLIEN